VGRQVGMRCAARRVASAAADHGPVAAACGGAGGGGPGWIRERELGTAEQLDAVDGKDLDGSDWREGLSWWFTEVRSKTL
jgi:hypothetical protein